MTSSLDLPFDLKNLILKIAIDICHLALYIGSTRIIILCRQ